MRLTEEMLIRVERQHEKIGQLLLRYTSLTEEQLAEALEAQEDSDLLIGEILLKKNYISPT